MSRNMLAFIDESMSDSRKDPGTYFLAAGICDPHDSESIAEEMERLRLKGQRKLHWHDEDYKRRLKITETVARLPLMHLLVVRDNMPDTKPERRRRLCMERMLWSLDQLEVAHVTLESRGAADDRRDMTMVATMRARKTLDGQMRIDHAPGPTDPRLWVPDAVCGAFTASRTGEPEFLDQLAVEVITLP